MKPKLIKDLPGVKAGTVGECRTYGDFIKYNFGDVFSFTKDYINKHPDFFEWVDDGVYWEPKYGERCYWYNSNGYIMSSSKHVSNDNFNNWKTEEHARKVVDAYLELRKKMHKEFYWRLT